MNKMKYICYDDGHVDTLIVFPDHIQHSDMARQLNLAQGMLLGAGFVVMGNDGAPMCYGDSVSLDIKSREEDTFILCNNIGAKPPEPKSD